MLEKELNLIFVSCCISEGKILHHIITFDCEFPLSCQGNCHACSPVKNRLAEIARDDPQSILKIIDVAAYDLLTGVVGQTEKNTLENTYGTYNCRSRN